jgi:hypothetical protein
MQILKVLPFCLLLFCSAYSQTERELWDSLQAKMTAGVKGNFQMTKYVAKISKTFFSEGNFEVSEKNGIIWETEKPIKSVEKMSMDSLKTFFSGDYKSLKNTFEVELSQKKGEQVLMLQPKERTKKKVVESVELRIVNNELRGCIITWGNKDKTLYEFSVP